MSASLFVITELPAPGTRRRAIRFEWDAKHRNAPFKPWAFGMELRTARTDYPGSNVPTEQVLGANYTDFTFEGRWSDKFNEPGYAMATQRQFEELVASGNRVRVQWDDIAFEGLIVAFDVEADRNSELRYSFTLSPHVRDRGRGAQRSPRTVLNVRQLLEEVDGVSNAAALAHLKAPKSFIVGSLHLDVSLKLELWTASVVSVGLTVDNRISLPEVEPGAALRRLASLFTEMVANAIDIRVQLSTARSDASLYYETGALTLSFDIWARSLAYEARRMMVAANRAATELLARAEPDAVALYRPYEGEHLYQVSNRFYGTPHNWRRIAARNGLLTTSMTGDELLVIPEATGR